MGELDLGPAFWALAALGTAAAMSYGTYFLNRPRTWVRAIVKTVFMAAFAGALVAAHAPPPLVLAIALSAAGDFFLAFDKKWLLPFGILSFLLAQLLYVVMFTAVWFFSGDNSPLWPRYGAMFVIIVSVASYLIWFWRRDLQRAPITGSLAVVAVFAVGLLIPWYIMLAVFPASVTAAIDAFATLISGGMSPGISSPLPEVATPLLLLLAALTLGAVRRDLGAVRLGGMVYAGAITLMALAAMWLPWVGWPASLGALLFLTSDFVLAAELFRLPADAPIRRVTAPIVWWTYAAAQVLIITGLILIVRAGV